MRKNKKLDFLLTVCLTLEIGGLIALFVGIVLKLFVAMFGGAIAVFGGGAGAVSPPPPCCCFRPDRRACYSAPALRFPPLRFPPHF